MQVYNGVTVVMGVYNSLYSGNAGSYKIAFKMVMLEHKSIYSGS